MSIEETIAGVRRDVTAAQRRAAGADANLAQAEARVGAAREDMQAEFGVDTVASARAFLGELGTRLLAEADEVSRQLELAGGPQ